MVEELKKKAGRPSKLTKGLAERIYFLSRKGLIDKEIADVLGLEESTLTRWKSNAQFCTLLKEAKAEIDDEVENALLRRAMGYDYDEEHYSEKAHSAITVTKKMHSDVTACIFWLKNRRRDRWRDQQGPLVDQSTHLHVTMHQLSKELNGNNRGSQEPSPEALPGPDLVLSESLKRESVAETNGNHGSVERLSEGNGKIG